MARLASLAHELNSTLRAVLFNFIVSKRNPGCKLARYATKSPYVDALFDFQPPALDVRVRSAGLGRAYGTKQNLSAYAKRGRRATGAAFQVP